jgi:NDP-sugar pyrophosphorylase family protein
MAYLMVVYRHETDLIQTLKRSVEKYVEQKRSTMGRIQSGSRISNCNTITNVSIGPYVSIKGIQLLQNGSVIGEKETATKVGEGVIAKNFIIQSGSSVDSGAIIDNTFIGQGVKIGKQFSAE